MNRGYFEQQAFEADQQRRAATYRAACGDAAAAKELYPRGIGDPAEAPADTVAFFLACDLKHGRITQDEYEAAVKGHNETTS